MIHFIAGLPRSGSTLLRNVLRQNPRVTANISSPLSYIFHDVFASLNNQDYAKYLNDAQRRRILKGTIEGFYKGDDLVFDTNRIWTSKLTALKELYPAAKFICPVRDPSWILNSYEKAFLKNPLRMSRMFNNTSNRTCFTRAEVMMNLTHGAIGLPLASLREAYMGHKADILLVPYEELTKHPGKTLADIYAFLGEPEYTHDFENVLMESEMFEDYDNVVGIPGLHETRRKVAHQEQAPVIPQELFAIYQHLDFWSHA